MNIHYIVLLLYELLKFHSMNTGFSDFHDISHKRRPRCMFSVLTSPLWAFIVISNLGRAVKDFYFPRISVVSYRRWGNFKPIIDSSNNWHHAYGSLFAMCGGFRYSNQLLSPFLQPVDEHGIYGWRARPSIPHAAILRRFFKPWRDSEALARANCRLHSNGGKFQDQI